MEPVIATLCPYCTECPSVEITNEGVMIGEDKHRSADTCRMERTRRTDKARRASRNLKTR